LKSEKNAFVENVLSSVGFQNTAQTIKLRLDKRFDYLTHLKLMSERMSNFQQLELINNQKERQQQILQLFQDSISSCN
jgi:hypothetical protein